LKLKILSTTNPATQSKNLSNWNEVITGAKSRIRAIKKSIAIWEELRDAGVECPTFESEEKLLGQDGDLGQSR